MESNTWREETLQKLTKYFSANESVVSFSIFGSLSKPEVEKDKWSDIDALLVVKDSAKNQFYPSSHWVEEQLGDIFASQITQIVTMCNMKVIFTDFRKIDFIITTEEQVRKGFPHMTKQKILLSKSDEITKILQEAPVTSTESAGDLFVKTVEDFWYIAFVAVTKLMRNDLLISLDLSLHLYQGCLHMAMLLRDKETGTNIHRIGGVRNDVVEKMKIQFMKMDKKGILSLIEQCCKEFDKLARECEKGYVPHFPTFENVLLIAKEEIQGD